MLVIAFAFNIDKHIFKLISEFVCPYSIKFITFRLFSTKMTQIDLNTQSTSKFVMPVNYNLSRYRYTYIVVNNRVCMLSFDTVHNVFAIII